MYVYANRTTTRTSHHDHFARLLMSNSDINVALKIYTQNREESRMLKEARYRFLCLKSNYTHFHERMILEQWLQDCGTDYMAGSIEM